MKGGSCCICGCGCICVISEECGVCEDICVVGVCDGGGIGGEDELLNGDNASTNGGQGTIKGGGDFDFCGDVCVEEWDDVFFLFFVFLYFLLK